MNFELLVCVKVERKKFEHGLFCGDDDILGIVESGEFVFDDGNGLQTVGEYEGVIFKKGITYKRKVTKPLVMHLFRYKSPEDIFEGSKIVFKDKQRIKSTVCLLGQLSDSFYYNDFECKKSLLSDIFTQYIIENKYIGTALPDDKVVADAVTEINKNITKNIKPEQLAKKSYLSYIQFSRRFKNAMGVTPQEYINSMRMEKAKYLLCESTVPVKKIAVECGFANEYYFSRFFKKYNNISPTRYRKISVSLI